MNAGTFVMLTPPGRAALATLRLEGQGVRQFLARRFSRHVEPLRCTHGDLSDDRGVIDDPVVVLHRQGRCVDITLHAGPAVIEAATSLALAEGFEPATETRADAASLVEAEVLDALPNAPDDTSISLLLGQPQAWRDLIRSKPKPERLRAILDEVALETLLARPGVAIVGRPNAGKSTLANALAGTDRSIVSDRPGTTRDWVGSTVDLRGITVTLIDTPGRRETPDPIEQRAIEVSYGVVREAKVIVLVADGTEPVGSVAALRGAHPGAILVRSKVDLPAHPSWTSEPATAVCARTGEGLDNLRRVIRRSLGVDGIDASRPYAWTKAQRERIARVLEGASPASLDPPVVERLRLPKSMRLHRQTDFRRVQSRGRRFTAGPLTIFSMLSDSARLGIRTPRAVGSAPRRNRIKRMLREAFRSTAALRGCSLDILVIVRPHEPMSIDAYRDALLDAVSRQQR